MTIICTDDRKQADSTHIRDICNIAWLWKFVTALSRDGCRISDRLRRFRIFRKFTHAFRCSAEYGYTPGIERYSACVSQGTIRAALYTACEKGRTHVVDYFVRKIYDKFNEDYISVAIKNGHLKTFQYLIQNIQLEDLDVLEGLLGEAMTANHVHIVRKMHRGIKVLDPDTGAIITKTFEVGCRCRFIKEIARNGAFSVLRYIKRYHPDFIRMSCVSILKEACKQGNFKMFLYFYKYASQCESDMHHISYRLLKIVWDYSYDQEISKICYHLIRKLDNQSYTHRKNFNITRGGKKYTITLTQNYSFSGITRLTIHNLE